MVAGVKVHRHRVAAVHLNAVAIRADSNIDVRPPVSLLRVVDVELNTRVRLERSPVGDAVVDDCVRLLGQGTVLVLQPLDLGLQAGNLITKIADLDLNVGRLLDEHLVGELGHGASLHRDFLGDAARLAKPNRMSRAKQLSRLTISSLRNDPSDLFHGRSLLMSLGVPLRKIVQNLSSLVIGRLGVCALVVQAPVGIGSWCLKLLQAPRESRLDRRDLSDPKPRVHLPVTASARRIVRHCSS